MFKRVIKIGTRNDRNLGLKLNGQMRRSKGRKKSEKKTHTSTHTFSEKIDLLLEVKSNTRGVLNVHAESIK